MSPDEIATMLDLLADDLFLKAVEDSRPRGALTGDQALALVILALREIAEKVSRS